MDPNQKKNIFNNAMDMMMNSMVISEFQTIMREYIDLHCIATNGAQCVKPTLLFGLTGAGYFGDDPEEIDTTKEPVTCFEDPNAGGECCHDRDCDGDKTCDTGYCVDPPCDCNSDEICEMGTCIPFVPPTTTLECEHAGDCRSDEECFMNQCVPELPPPATLPPSDPCDGVTCRGSQVCNNGVCERPSKDSGSSSRSSDRERTSSGRGSSGSSGSSERGSGSSDSSRSSG